MRPDKIFTEINEAIDIKRLLLSNEIIDTVYKISEMIVSAYDNGNKVLLCGNGGSGSCALHIEGEFVGRFKNERKGLAAIALGAGFASLTSIANDYGYDRIFQRHIEAVGTKGDVLLAFSTSGNSRNVITAVNEAKLRGIVTIGFLGKGGGELAELVNIPLIVPSDNTPRIQECHIMLGHIICGLVEDYISNLNNGGSPK